MDSLFDCTSRRALTAPTRLGIFAVALLGLTSCDSERIRDILDSGKGGESDGGSSTDGGTGTPKVTCGALTGTTCPGSGRCVDDPTDKCDPSSGGADCPGSCQCIQNQACIKGDVFDPSPKVCACVPAVPVPPACGPVCDIYCQYGHVVDAKGCETCACNLAPPTDPCAATTCMTGTHCTTVVPPCIAGATTCPLEAVCVPNASDGVSCGGIAGIACPGNGRCVDDPNDGCDPHAGGADCGGICQCIQTVDCVKGATFDSSPKICACVNPTPPPPTCGPVCEIYCPYGNVLDQAGCPTCACNPPPSDDPCAAALCMTGTHCVALVPPCAPDVKTCPLQATCVPNTPQVTCGGIAGIACPGSGKCVDDPSDMCDPKAGGADCGGICACVQNVACVKGATFDSSPKVCACVASNPPSDPCAAVRCATGTHCESRPSQCPGSCVPCPLEALCVPDAPAKVACGGIASIACPGFGGCVDDPTDMCDPNAGGADCGGVCSCIETVLCVQGTTFDSSPKVCACVTQKT